MQGLAQVLNVLLNQGMLSAAFLIGAITFVVALLGKNPIGYEDIPSGARFFLGLFGFVLVVASLGGGLLSTLLVINNPPVGSVSNVNVVESSENIEAIITQVVVVTATPQPPMTPITIDSFCAFLTPSQISSLRQVQDARDAISQAEAFAGYRQNDYVVGQVIPRNVVIATNIHTTNFDSVGVTPINNINGYGLFLTDREIVASYPGTYWCIRDDSSVTVTPQPQITSTNVAVSCRTIKSEHNVPETSTYTLIVEPNQYHVWSSGRIAVSYGGQVLSNVHDEGYKGFISVFLPVNNQATTYNISNVNPRYNYHAIYENCSHEQRIIDTNRHANDLTRPGDCGGAGCREVYIRVFQGNSYQEELFSP